MSTGLTLDNTTLRSTRNSYSAMNTCNDTTRASTSTEVHRHVCEKPLVSVIPEPRRCSLDSLREDNLALWEELCRIPGYSIPEIDVLPFIDNLLPPLKNGIDAETIVSSLRRDGLVGAKGRWKNFKTKLSNNRTRRRNDVLMLLKQIFERVTRLASSSIPDLEQITTMILTPKRVRNSDRRIAKLGGYFVLRDREVARSRSWLDIALTTEFKDSSSDDGDNISRLVLNMQQTMIRDASRRFTFGITVEDTAMRLWFCSRGIAVVSKPFDFTKEVNLLTRVFLSLAFASKEELGLDPTIRPIVRGHGKQAYHIDVDGQTYETVEVLAETAAETLLSRATRVWKVKLLGSDDEYVLKDIWVEDDRNLEHVIYEMILRDVEEKYGTDARNDVASHLITPVAHWLVRVNGEEDHTTRVCMRGYTPPFDNKFRVIVMENEADEDADMPPSIDSKSERVTFRAAFPFLGRLRKLTHRRHYRVVFREVADVLYTIRTLSDVFGVLGDVAKVLKWIHGSGWVHRDISVGNLYHYDGRGLLSDLEFAKRRNYDVEHEVRTGTLDSIAVEARERMYLHVPEMRDEELHTQIQFCLADRMEELSAMEKSRVFTPFFHNDLHDLESLWWVAIYELVFHRDSSEIRTQSRQTAKRDAQRETTAQELFRPSKMKEDRRFFLHHEEHFARMLAWTHERLDGIKNVLNILRGLLVKRYTSFEAEYPALRPDVVDGTHVLFGRLFEKCKESAAGIQLMPYKMTGRQLSLPTDAGLLQVLPDGLAHRVDRCAGRDLTSSASPSLTSMPKTPPPMVKGTPEVIKCPSKKRKRDNDGLSESISPSRMARFANYHKTDLI